MYSILLLDVCNYFGSEKFNVFGGVIGWHWSRSLLEQESQNHFLVGWNGILAYWYWSSFSVSFHKSGAKEQESCWISIPGCVMSFDLIKTLDSFTPWHGNPAVGSLVRSIFNAMPLRCHVWLRGIAVPTFSYCSSMLQSSTSVVLLVLRSSCCQGIANLAYSFGLLGIPHRSLLRGICLAPGTAAGLRQIFRAMRNANPSLRWDAMQLGYYFQHIHTYIYIYIYTYIHTFIYIDAIGINWGQLDHFRALVSETLCLMCGAPRSPCKTVRPRWLFRARGELHLAFSNWLSKCWIQTSALNNLTLAGV